MFVFHVTGLCLCVAAKNRLEVLMLNAGGSEKFVVPHHIPTLVAKRSSVRSYTLPRLPSLRGRFSDVWRTETSYGWHIGALQGDCGDGTLPAVVHRPVADDINPTRESPDWSSVHWVFDLNTMWPVKSLNTDYRRLGRGTASIVRFRGGELRGGQPFGTGANWIWSKRPGYEQAFTDTIDLVYDVPPRIQFIDSDSRPSGSVEWEEHGEAWLINEAPERVDLMKSVAGDASNDESMKPVCHDMILYLEAMGGTKAEGDALQIRPLRQFRGGLSTGPHCEAGLVRVPD